MGRMPVHLIQILLPLYDNVGNAFPHEEYDRIRHELTERFGGITTYVRSPAQGMWKETESKTVHDDIIIYEVMTAELDRGWWREFREELTRRYRQESLIVRAMKIELL
jgi:hypothetical protein